MERGTAQEVVTLAFVATGWTRRTLRRGVAAQEPAHMWMAPSETPTHLADRTQPWQDHKAAPGGAHVPASGACSLVPLWFPPLWTLGPGQQGSLLNVSASQPQNSSWPPLTDWSPFSQPSR